MTLGGRITHAPWARVSLWLRSLRAGSAGFGDGGGEVPGPARVAQQSSWVGWDLAELLAWEVSLRCR